MMSSIEKCQLSLANLVDGVTKCRCSNNYPFHVALHIYLCKLVSWLKMQMQAFLAWCVVNLCIFVFVPKIPRFCRARVSRTGYRDHCPFYVGPNSLVQILKSPMTMIVSVFQYFGDKRKCYDTFDFLPLVSNWALSFFEMAVSLFDSHCTNPIEALD